jgi:hypothetical protein
MMVYATKPPVCERRFPHQNDTEAPSAPEREVDIFSADRKLAITRNPTGRPRCSAWTGQEAGNGRHVSVKIGYSEHPIMEEVDVHGRDDEYK